MEAALLAQYVVVVAAVATSLAFLIRRQFPAGVRRLRIACAVPLVRERRAPWVRRIGQWMAPKTMPAANACGGCQACDH